MDGLTLRSTLVKPQDLTTWNDGACPQYALSEENASKSSPFPFNSSLNARIAFWVGDPTTLSVDALMIPSNDIRNAAEGSACHQVFQKAGNQLLDELQHVHGVLRTGEARVTTGFGLPARYVIHTSSPKFNVKYRSAAESALFACYRNSLSIAHEYKLRHIAMLVIHSAQRGFPPEEGAHLCLRTVRRYLERCKDYLNLVILVMDPVSQGSYLRQFPIYFPRSLNEQQAMLSLLPDDIGNELGEPVHLERQLNIMDRPLLSENTPDGINLLGSFVGRHAFSKMSVNVDQKHVLKLDSPNSDDLLHRRKIYQRWVQRSSSEDFSDLIKMRFLYQAGYDFLGRPIIVLIAKNLVPRTIDENKLVSFFVSVMDCVTVSPYIFLYFHTDAKEENSLDSLFLRRLYDILEYRYRHNLALMLVVHVSLWTKILCWFFAAVYMGHVLQRLDFISELSELEHLLDLSQLGLPEFVMKYNSTRSLGGFLDHRLSP